MMMKPLALVAVLALCGCAVTTATTPASTTGVTPTSVCADMAALKAAPDAATALASVDPHSALGVIWADAQSGCNGAVPVAGVNASWTAEMWGMVRAIAPTVLPILIGLL